MNRLKPISFPFSVVGFFYVATMSFALLACNAEKNAFDSSIETDFFDALAEARTFDDLLQVDTLLLRVPGSNPIGKIKDIQFDAQGNMLMTDMHYARTLLKFDKHGRFVQRLDRLRQKHRNQNVSRL